MFLFFRTVVAKSQENDHRLTAKSNCTNKLADIKLKYLIFTATVVLIEHYLREVGGGVGAAMHLISQSDKFIQGNGHPVASHHYRD